MKMSMTGKLTAISMAFMMTSIPNTVLADRLITARASMIPTNVALAEVTRAQAENEVRDYLQRSEVQTQLMKQGLSAEEVSSRLSSLSEQEIRQLSGQVREVKAGGDILVAILLVVLIIYLIKRI